MLIYTSHSRSKVANQENSRSRRSCTSRAVDTQLCQHHVHASRGADGELLGKGAYTGVWRWVCRDEGGKEDGEEDDETHLGWLSGSERVVFKIRRKALLCCVLMTWAAMVMEGEMISAECSLDLIRRKTEPRVLSVSSPNLILKLNLLLIRKEVAAETVPSSFILDIRHN
jgi:hypothetical protein